MQRLKQNKHFRKSLIYLFIFVLLLSTYLPYIPIKVEAATITPPNSTVDTKTLLTVSPSIDGIGEWYYEGLTNVRNSSGVLGSVRRYVSKDKSKKIYMVSGELAATWANTIAHDGSHVFRQLQQEKTYYSFNPSSSSGKSSFSQYSFLDLLDLAGYTYSISSNVITINETPLPKVTEFKIKESPSIRGCYPLFSPITIQFSVEEYMPSTDVLRNIQVYGIWEGKTDSFKIGEIELVNSSNGKYSGQFQYTLGENGKLSLYIRAYDGANRVDQDSKTLNNKAGNFSPFGQKIEVCTAAEIKDDGQTIPMYDYTNSTLLNTNRLIQEGLAGRQNGKMGNYPDGNIGWFGPVRYPTIYKGYPEDGGFRTDVNKNLKAEGRDQTEKNILAYPFPFLYILGPINPSIAKPNSKVHDSIPTQTVNVQHKMYFQHAIIKEMFNGNSEYVLNNTPTFEFSTMTGKPLGNFYYIRDLAEYSGADVSNNCTAYNDTCLEIYTTDNPDITEFQLHKDNDYTKINNSILFEFSGFEYVSNRKDGTVRNDVKYTIEILKGPSQVGEKIEGTIKSNKSIKNTQKKYMDSFAGKYTNPSKVEFKPEKQGKYTVQLTIIDSVQRSTKSKLIAFEIGPNGGPRDPDDVENPDDEEPKKQNLPPTVQLLGPDVVEVGQKFCLRADAYDPDGYIEFYDWNWYSGEIEDDENAFTGSIQCGLYYEDATEDEVWVQVTDNDGASAEDTHKIKVIYPSPSADFEVHGYLIENRAVWITPDRPYFSDIKIVSKLQIVKNTWKIEALDKDNQSSIIVIEDDLNNSKIDEVIEVLFRKAGEYKITRYVENRMGSSDTVTKTITIQEDLLPVAELETAETVYLGKDGKGTVTFYSKSYSVDDYIGTHIYEIAHDSNNDGSFEDEEFKVIGKTGVSEFNYNVSKLGKYQVRLTVIEEFNEPTYESHVDLSENLATTHRKYSQTMTTFEVDNMAPVVSLSAKEQPEVELIFDMGDTLDSNAYTKAKLQSQINGDLLPNLAKEGINPSIDIIEREYYRDVSGQYLKDRYENKYYFLDYETGILSPTTAFTRPYGSTDFATDYEGNLYYTITDKISLYKYDRKNDKIIDLINHDFILNYAKSVIPYNATNGNEISNDRIIGGFVSDIIIGENENVFIRLALKYKDCLCGNWEEKNEYYLVEFAKDSMEIIRFVKSPKWHYRDTQLKIRYISDTYIYTSRIPYDEIFILPLDELTIENGLVPYTRLVFENGSDFAARLLSQGKGKDKIAYVQNNYRDGTTYYVKNNVEEAMWDNSRDYKNLGGTYHYIIDSEFFGPLRDNTTLVRFDYIDEYRQSYSQAKRDYFIRTHTPEEYTSMPSGLRSAVVHKLVSYGTDGTVTFIDRYKRNLFKVDEKTKQLIETIDLNNLNQLGNSSISSKFDELDTNNQRLVLRAYKKTLADTLKDVEWKSKTSKKFFVTLSNKEINNLPKENPEVASLLNQDDIHFISIDTNSTKSIAQQLMTALEEESLQITTTYTDNNMKTAMQRIAEFIIGVVFPEEDEIIDIHVGVENSKFSLAQIQQAINTILKPRLNNTEYQINITSSELVTKSVNGQSVRKFNVSKEQDYYILFKDNAITETNLNHLAADLLLHDAYFIGVGNTSAKAQFEKAIEKNMYRGTIFENPTDLTQTMNDLSTYLFDTIRKRAKETDIYGTIEQNKVLYETHYNDYEDNPKYREKFETIHEPTVFENHQGKVTFGIANAPEIFTKVGLYKPTYQAMDDPLVNYSDIDKQRFANYRKWSNVAGDINIYVHRLPVPDFHVSVNVNTNYYTIQNKAYDLDKQSINIGLGGGIAEQKFQWRLKGEIVWKDGLPPNPLQEKIYEIKNEVMDFQKQKNYIIKEVSPFPLPPVAEFEPVPSTIEQGDRVDFINTSYEPTGQNMTAQWYYKKSTASNYIHFATGSYINGVGNANWNPSTNLLTEEGVYDIKLVVTDTDGLSDETVRQVFVEKKKNRPPKACMVVPSPNYIGDTITIENCSTDPDGDYLISEYVVTKPNGQQFTYSTGDTEVTTEGNLIIKANQHPVDIGTWKIKLTIYDKQNESDSVEGTMIVLDQIVQGNVAHTEQWLKNIQHYNEQFPSKAFNLNPENGLLEFFKGEKFMLSAKETKLATDIAVAIKEYPQFGITKLREGANDVWYGSLFHEEMYYTFKDQEVLTFEFVAVFQNGWVARDEVKIKIRDENYWVQHTTY